MFAELALAAALTLGSGTEVVRALSIWRPTPAGPTALERLVMEARPQVALEELRAGAPAMPASAPTQDERAALDAAQRVAGDLERQRAGDLELSDREIAIVAVTAAAVLLLVILL